MYFKRGVIFLYVRGVLSASLFLKTYCVGYGRRVHSEHSKQMDTCSRDSSGTSCSDREVDGMNGMNGGRIYTSGSGGGGGNIAVPVAAPIAVAPVVATPAGGGAGSAEGTIGTYRRDTYDRTTSDEFRYRRRDSPPRVVPTWVHSDPVDPIKVAARMARFQSTYDPEQ